MSFCFSNCGRRQFFLHIRQIGRDAPQEIRVRVERVLSISHGNPKRMPEFACWLLMLPRACEPAYSQPSGRVSLSALARNRIQKNPVADRDAFQPVWRFGHASFASHSRQLFPFDLFEILNQQISCCAISKSAGNHRFDVAFFVNNIIVKRPVSGTVGL